MNILEWCKRFIDTCYVCPKCGLHTFGRATSYHWQVHGRQDVLWEPSMMNKKVDDVKEAHNKDGNHA